MTLDTNNKDYISWSWEKNDAFSAQSTYAVTATTSFTWTSKAPLHRRFFAWLAIKDRCWTLDRLARRGLLHQDTCPFCDQHGETLDHILVSCVFTREVWHLVHMATDRPDLAPRIDEPLKEQCIWTELAHANRRTTRAICILGLWELWKHRNGIVFDGASPSTNHVIERINTEGKIWRQAGLLKGDPDGFFAVLLRRV